MIKTAIHITQNQLLNKDNRSKRIILVTQKLKKLHLEK